MFNGPSHSRYLAALLCGLLLTAPVTSFSANGTGTAQGGSGRVVAKPSVKPAVRSTTTVARSAARYGVPTFADSEKGDDAQFDDPIIRQAAIEGLGRYNGSVVAI